MKKSWGIFCMEKEVELVKDQVDKKGLEIFEVRKLNFWEKLQYCKDPMLFANEPWIIMFRASTFQYKMLFWKLKLRKVF